MRRHVDDLLVTFGCVVIASGIALVNIPAGVIFWGVAMVVGGLLVSGTFGGKR